ncbi:MAG: AAA family ATPase [archaeon]
MIEANSPIDIGKEEIKQYRSDVEDNLLINFPYSGSKKLDLTDMIRKLDEEEPYIMTDVENNAYKIIREGMQIFKAISNMVGDKVGLRAKIVNTPYMELSTNPEVLKLQDFTYNFAAYAASTYISKKLDSVLSTHIDLEHDKEDKPDFSNISFSTNKIDSLVIKNMLYPIYNSLVKHEDTKEVFQTEFEFPMYVKELFEHFKDLTFKNKDAHPDLMKEIEPYRFRIMDEFVSLQGYEDMAITQVAAKKQKISVAPIDAKEIMGNVSAKRKICRYVDRLFLYNPTTKMNPILTYGGLSWTNLMDGLPGTGKSSLFRLAITIAAKRSEQTGIPLNVFTIDQSVKDEYYGKSGKILLERVGVTKDPLAISIGILDDLDLLTSNRDDAQGADNDINNILMQYLDGVFTLRLGNVINFAASNKPTGLDGAVRNRMSDRLLIDGPVTSEDFADILYMQSKKLREGGLIKIEEGYTPMATQDVQNEDGSWTLNESVSEYMAEMFNDKKFKNATIKDFGDFMADLKTKNPSITGRSSKAIMDAIKERTADFDIQPELFENRALFLDKDFKEQENILKEMYNEITPDVLFQEAQRYFDSEQRYADTEASDAVIRGYNSMLWGIQAEMKFLENNMTQGKHTQIDLVKYQKLKVAERLKYQETDATVQLAIKHYIEEIVKEGKLKN